MNSRHSFKHNAQTDARIREGYAASEPVEEIAAAIGISKNAVIGRARRIGAKYDDLSIAKIRAGEKMRGRENPKRAAHWATIPREARCAFMAKIRAARHTPTPKEGE